MDEVHLWTGIAVIATNLLAGVWGGVAWLRREPSEAFWYLLRIAQATVLLQVLFGTVLLLSGRESPDGLHYLYGLLPLLVSFLAEGARVSVPERELEGLDFDALPAARRRAIALAIVRSQTGIMALSALVVVGLALRAATIDGGI
jgi:hypothetical protein